MPSLACQSRCYRLALAGNLQATRRLADCARPQEYSGDGERKRGEADDEEGEPQVTEGLLQQPGDQGPHRCSRRNHHVHEGDPHSDFPRPNAGQHIRYRGNQGPEAPGNAVEER